MIYNKLVRDNIPEIIKAENKEPVTHVADDEEYHLKLNEKLLEEVTEYIESEDPKEIADILEVLDAIILFKKFDKDEVLAIQKTKRVDRGAFLKKIILDCVD